MLLTPVLPSAGPAHDVSTDAGRTWLARAYAPGALRYVRLNMITSLTGAAVGADGTSETLSNRVDRRILGVIRAAADAVLVGAATVRAEGYLAPRSGVLAILTSTGDLDGHRLHDAADRVVLVCPSARAREVAARAALPEARVLGVGATGRPTPAETVEALTRVGLGRIVCEGGPSVAAAFATAGLIDEYCVTVAPTLVPASSPFLPLPSGTHLRTEVAGMLVDEAGFSYLRLQPRR
jgi:riboflavin biosynthesis pyrimidine reductase